MRTADLSDVSIEQDVAGAGVEDDLTGPLKGRRGLAIDIQSRGCDLPVL